MVNRMEKGSYGGQENEQENEQGSSEGGASTADKLQMAKMGLDLFKASTGEDYSTDSEMGAAEGAIGGAMIGSTMGPIGAGIGAVAGGLTGALKARSARKAAARKAESDHQERLAKIEESKATNMRNAIASMSAQIGATLRSV